MLAAGNVCGDFAQERISTEDAWWAVGVVGGGPAVPTPLFSPSTGAVDVDPWKATLKWEAYQVNPESEWEIQASKDTAFSDPVATTTSDTVSENGILMGRADLALKPHTHYYWRVRRKVSDPSLSCWRPVQDFTTRDKRPTAISPVRQEFYPWGLPFKWSAVSHATGYTIEVATDPSFSPAALIFEPVESDANEKVLSVKVKSQLFWHVRTNFAQDAQSEAVHSRWSKTARFNTRIPRVKLVSPIAVATGPWPVVFKWQKNHAADHYLLEVTGEKFDPASPSYRQLEDRIFPGYAQDGQPMSGIAAWFETHRRILRFAATLPSNRYLRVKAEDLLNDMHAQAHAQTMRTKPLSPSSSSREMSSAFRLLAALMMSRSKGSRMAVRLTN